MEAEEKTDEENAEEFINSVMEFCESQVKTNGKLRNEITLLEHRIEILENRIYNR